MDHAHRAQIDGRPGLGADGDRSPRASSSSDGPDAGHPGDIWPPPTADRLLDTLLAAFHDDPLYRWLYPDEISRPRALRQNFGLTLRLARERGHIEATPDGSAVALWTEPGVPLLEDPAPFIDLLDRWAPRRRDAALEGMLACADFARETDQTLHVLAVHPARQGRGAAARLLAPTLAELDRAGVPAYLESTNVRNVTFYARCGFDVLGEVTVSGGGPVVRPMRRRAGTA